MISKEKMSAVAKSPLTHFIVIAALGIVAYSNTFHGPFQLDEHNYLFNNPFTINLGYPIEALKADPELYKTLHQRYIGFLTFALNYKFHKLSVEGYHIVNLTIHTLNALLIYCLLALTFKTPFLERSQLADTYNYIALFSALIFISHPVQTGAVTYIMQRLASLAALFYLFSLVLYIKWGLSHEKTDTRPQLAHNKIFQRLSRHPVFLYLSSLTCAVLSMKTKENTFTLPLAIALYDFSFFRGEFKQKLIRLLPILLTLFVIPVTTLILITESGKSIDQLTGSAGIISRWDYLLTEFRVILTYIRLLILPIKQNVDYDYPVYSSFFELPVVLSFFFIVILLILACYLFYRSRFGDPALRLISFGIFWFFLTLSVESSIMPLPNTIDEYRIYLPSVGFSAATLTALFLLSNFRNARMLKAVIVLLSLASLSFAFGTYKRNILWQDNIRLWEDIVSKSPNKAGPHNNLGKFYDKAGRYDDAVKEFQIAKKLNPTNMRPRRNLIITYVHQGRLAEAEREFRESLGPGVDAAAGYYYLGGLLAEEGMFDEAAAALRNALRLNPRYREAREQLGRIFAQHGRPGEAIRELEAAAALDPAAVPVRYDLGVLYAQLGRFNDAARVLETVVKLDTNHAEAYNNLGGVYLELGRPREALTCLESALRLRPGEADIRYNIEMIRERMRREGLAR